MKKQLAIERIGITSEELEDIVVTEEQRSKMHAITPIDGRYKRYVPGLSDLTSEFAWTKRRVMLEVEYAISLANEFEHYYKGDKRKILPHAFSGQEKEVLRSLYKEFNEKDFRQIQEIDKKSEHDTAAMVRWIGSKLHSKDVDPDKFGFSEEAAHFGLTSSDINTNVYNLIVADILREEYLPTLIRFQETMIDAANSNYHNTIDDFLEAFAGQTHGQFAEYTTLNKIFANIADGINQTIADEFLIKNESNKIVLVKLPGKLAGAIGNHDDLRGAYPDHDWLSFSKRFVENLGLRYAPMCDQDEFNIRNSKLYDAIVRINDVIWKFCDDFWEYASNGLFVKKTGKEVSGSTVMAQKVNPWRLEGGWELIDDSSSSFQKYHNLTKYKRQGDLRRSIRKRFIGEPFAKAIIGMKRIIEEVERYQANMAIIKKEVNEHPEMFSAYVQTVLKREGISDAYDEIKDLTKGKKVTIGNYKAKLLGFVEQGTLKKEVYEEIVHGLNPKERTGYATRLAHDTIRAAKASIELLEVL